MAKPNDPNPSADNPRLTTPLIHKQSDQHSGHNETEAGKTNSGETEVGDTLHGGHAEIGDSSNTANGNGANGNGHNGHHNGDQTLSVDDPRTRALLEQLLTVVNQDGSGGKQTSSRGSVPDFMGVLRRRWKPALLMFLLVTLTVSWKLRPGEVSYVSTATMLLPKSSGSDVGSALDALGGRRNSAGNALDTQIAILESYPFVQKAQKQAKENLKDFTKAKPDAIAAIDRATIKATAPLSPELVDITVTSDDPDASRAMANASVQVYARELVRQSDTTLSSDKNFVRDKVSDVGQQLAQAKRELQNFKEANQVFDVGASMTTSSASIEQLKDKERAMRIDAEAGATGSLVLGDAITQSLQQRASDAKLAYETILRDFYPSSPEAGRARANWQTAQAQVDNRISKLTAQSRQRSEDATRELAEAQSRAAGLPKVEFTMSQLQARVQQLSDTYKTVTDRFTQLQLTGSAKAATVFNQVPAMSALAISRTWSRAILVGLLIGLVLAAMCAILLEQLDHSLHSVEDLEPLLPAPVLGAMPLLRGRGERRLAQMTGAQPMAPHILEACRIIRSNMAFATMDSPAQTVLVSSAGAGEGKSLTALNIATVMAFDGRRVLLLDCDLRRPSQHTLNGLPLEPGFTNLLAGEIDLNSAIQDTKVNNLSVLTAGTLPLNPPELLGSRDTRQWLHVFKEQFDVVIIDSPPVLALTDAQVLCSQVDGVMMVVAADTTSKSDVQRAQAMLRHAGGRLLGAVFNKVKRTNHSGGYYAYGPSYGANLLDRDQALADSVGTLSNRS